MNAFTTTPALGSLVLSFGLLLLTNIDRTVAATPEVFPNPEAAIAALDQAVATTNRIALDALFGDDVQQLVNPDEVQGAAELATFAAAFQESHRLIRNSDLRMTLEVGSNGWPFPIPLVKSDSGWSFDAQAGVEELLNRRIGRNELDVLRVLRAFVQAKILTRQGRHAPGGKHDYVINGNMIGGFALVAWPAEYGESGIMTFIVNQQGRVYQRDLGTSTARIAAKLRDYDPDRDWQISAD